MNRNYNKIQAIFLGLWLLIYVCIGAIFFSNFLPLVIKSSITIFVWLNAFGIRCELSALPEVTFLSSTNACTTPIFVSVLTFWTGILGGMIGLSQWLLLRKCKISVHWIICQVRGWMIGAAIGYFLSLAIYKLSGAIHFNFLLTIAVWVMTISTSSIEEFYVLKKSYAIRGNWIVINIVSCLFAVLITIVLNTLFFPRPSLNTPLWVTNIFIQTGLYPGFLIGLVSRFAAGLKLSRLLKESTFKA